MGLVFLCAHQAQLATDTYRTALEDMRPLPRRRQRGLVSVAQYDFNDACGRYSLDESVAGPIRDLLTQSERRVTSTESPT
jgi:hypothetical protein